MRVPTFREWILSLFLSISLGVALAFGFVPSTTTAGGLLSSFLGISSLRTQKLIEMAVFTAITILFFVSIPKTPSKKDPMRLSWIAKISLLPILIAVVFGIFHPAPTIFSRFSSDHDGLLLAIAWYIVLIPVGEECLFRGWLYNVLEKMFPDTVATLTNPLPLSLWLSSLSFSLWHIQNLSTDGYVLGGFQVLYTFFTGIWLGYLRWKTDTITFPILAHGSINLASNLL